MARTLKNTFRAIWSETPRGSTIVWIAEDVVWSYPFPIPECPKIENFMAFYNEHVDAIYVDDELMPVPKTPWPK